MSIHQWALRWQVSPAALHELQYLLGLYTPPLTDDSPAHGKSEAFAQSQVRIEASRKGVTLFRNNVGALQDEDGRWIRYGLANDSKTLNETIKSGDLIGWRPVVITPQHVGFRIAQFVSREIKAPGWQFTGVGREVQQKAWADAVNAAGGDAGFATGEGTL